MPQSHIPCLEGVILTVFREGGGKIRFLVCSVMREGQEGEKAQVRICLPQSRKKCQGHIGCPLWHLAQEHLCQYTISQRCSLELGNMEVIW